MKITRRQLRQIIKEETCILSEFRMPDPGTSSKIIQEIIKLIQEGKIRPQEIAVILPALSVANARIIIASLSTQTMLATAAAMAQAGIVLAIVLLLFGAFAFLFYYPLSKSQESKNQLKRFARDLQRPALPRDFRKDEAQRHLEFIALAVEDFDGEGGDVIRELMSDDAVRLVSGPRADETIPAITKDFVSAAKKYGQSLKRQAEKLSDDDDDWEAVWDEVGEFMPWEMEEIMGQQVDEPCESLSTLPDEKAFIEMLKNLKDELNDGLPQISTMILIKKGNGKDTYWEEILEKMLKQWIDMIIEILAGECITPSDRRDIEDMKELINKHFKDLGVWEDLHKINALMDLIRQSLGLVSVPVNESKMKITRRQLRQIIKEALQLEKSDRLFPHSDLPQPSDSLPDKVNRLITLMAVMNDSLPDRIDDLENQMEDVVSTLESQDDNTTMIFKQDAEDIEVEEPDVKRLARPDIIREAVVDNMAEPTREEARIALLNLQDRTERPVFSDIVVLANFIRSWAAPEAALRILKTLKTSPAILKNLADRLEGISFGDLTIVNDIGNPGQSHEVIKQLASEILSVIELSLGAGVSKIARPD